MPEIEDDIHPLDLLARREPMTGAGVSVVIVSREADHVAGNVGRGLARLIEDRGRAAEWRIATLGVDFGSSLSEAIAEARHPLLIVTTARSPWSGAHLDPLLDSIDRHDHVVGVRQMSFVRRALRHVLETPLAILFACRLYDPHSPCRIHRREKLAEIVFQSKGAFLDWEWVAKANHLVHLIQPVDLPFLESEPMPPTSWIDFETVWRRPSFRPLKTT
ncbi:MAG: hypothetical protein SFX72_17630 [Isosphaeraceae bacterium]|nr:hypothetical protein [Isosphaeraceae bacterium]